MPKEYTVIWGGQVVGRVEVKQEGLYCHVSCHCRVADGKIHRLFADGMKLGVLIPGRGGLVLETKVAAKHLRPDCLFTLDESRETFVPIRPGESFSYLDKLRHGKLSFRNGELGVFFE